MLKTITEKTLIPLSFVIVIIAGTMWLANLHFKVDNILIIKNDIKKIARDVSYIKGALGIKEISQRKNR